MEVVTTAVREKTSRRKAAIALILLVPAPFIGTWFGLYSDEMRGTAVGQAVYAAAKVWLLALPLVWLFLVEKGQPSWSPPRRGGLGIGVITGLVISAGIIIGWLLAGRHLIDPVTVRETVQSAGIGEPLRYAVFALYICTINAVLEEYVWRWFVYRQSEALVGAGAGAVVLSAFFFTIHHVLALLAQFDWLPALLASLGVFAGGCIWSGLYLRYRSIWPGFISHVLVDIAIFILGAWILFT